MKIDLNEFSKYDLTEVEIKTLMGIMRKIQKIKFEKTKGFLKFLKRRKD